MPFAGVAHLVERDLAKVEVASSSLVARSKTPSCWMGFSFLEMHRSAGEPAASTCAERVKSRGEAGFLRMATAIRGMPGSEFEPRSPHTVVRVENRKETSKDFPRKYPFF